MRSPLSRNAVYLCTTSYLLLLPRKSSCSLKPPEISSRHSSTFSYFPLLSPLLLPPPTTSCLLLFLPAPVCSYLLVPPPTSSRFLPLTPVSPTSSCLLLPLPSGFRRALWSLLGAFRKLFKGLLGASGGLFRGFVRPLGASWKLQGAFGGPLGVLESLWDFWDLFGGFSEACWRPRRGLLGASSWFLEPLGTFVGASLGL